MDKWIECVPNFSEGKRVEVIHTICDYIRAVPGVCLLGHHMDGDLNRTVITFVGGPEQVVEAAFRAIRKAAEHIDLKLHKGEHPRMGASDVCPFVPLRNATMEDCVLLAHKLGKRVGEELQIPVFLYEAAASKPERKNLSYIRNEQFEKLQKLIGKDANYTPDYGPHLIHPTAGAVAIGARFFLVAYNVNLRTTDVNIAKKIAQQIREKDGGLSGIRALGFSLAGRQMVQVSTNICDYRKTSISQVFGTVSRLAMSEQVEIADSELIGFAPADAIAGVCRETLKLRDFTASQMLEQRLAEIESDPLQSPAGFIKALAAPSPTPGGGSASAMAGAMAAALGSMAIGITLKAKKYQHMSERFAPHLRQLNELQRRLFHLVQEDSEAYQSFVVAKKMPENTEEEKKNKANDLQKTTLRSLLMPMDTMKQALSLLEILPDLADYGNPNLISDVGVACYLAMAALEGGALNVRINLPLISDTEVKAAVHKDLAAMLEQAGILHTQILQKVASKLASDLGSNA
jgi:glutamate formiminotransferase/formiminotetrahydrofolate cyclodeaminase